MTGRGGGANNNSGGGGRGNAAGSIQGPGRGRGGLPPRLGVNPANDPAVRRSAEEDDDDSSDEDDSYDDSYDEEEDDDDDEEDEQEDVSNAGGGNGVAFVQMEDAFRGFLMNLGSMGGDQGGSVSLGMRVGPRPVNMGAAPSAGAGPPAADPNMMFAWGQRSTDGGGLGSAGPPMAMMDPSGRMFTFGMTSDNANPPPRIARPVKCPVCNKETPYASATSAGGGSVTDTRLEERCSHHARTMFVSAHCPVCMEDNVGPPMVGLRCGHCVCPDDFQLLGGKMGANAMMTPLQAHQFDVAEWNTKEEERRRLEREQHGQLGRGGNSGTSGGGAGAGGTFGEAGPQLPGGETAEEALLMQHLFQFYRTQIEGANNAQGAGDDDDSDDDDDDEDPYGSGDDDDDDDDNFDDLPPLIPTTAARGTTAPAAAAARPPPSAGANPASTAGPPPAAAQNRSSAASAAAPAGTAGAGAPGRVVPVAGGAASDDDDDDDDGPPPLLPRAAAPRAGGGGGAARPARRGAEEEKSDGGPPPLLPRGAADSDDDDDDDFDDDSSDASGGVAGLPELIPRKNVDSDDEGDSSFVADADDDDDDDSSLAFSAVDDDSDAPPPLMGGGGRRPDTSRRASAASNRRGTGGGGEDRDSSPPPLMPPPTASAKRKKKNKKKKKKNQAQRGNADANRAAEAQDSDGSDEEDDDMPGLINASGRMPAVAAAAAASNDSDADDRTDDAKVSVEERRKARFEQEKGKAMKMRVADLKRSLQGKGIQLHAGMEKSELANLHAQAVVDAEFFRVEVSATAATSAASSRAESDLPPLVSAKPVPRNGCWVLAPVRGGAAMELQYAVVQDGTIRFDRTPARSFRKGSLLIPCRSGTRAYVCELQQAVPPAWEVRLVTSFGGSALPPIPLCNLPCEPSRADLLANPRSNDIWALTKEGRASNRQLFVTTFRDPSCPIKLAEFSNANVQLVAAEDSGAWLHVEDSGSGAGSASTMARGLWHVSIDGVWAPATKVLLHCGEVGEGAHVTPTLEGNGVWTVSRRNETNGTTTARCVLTLKTVEGQDGEEGAEKRVASTSSKTLDLPFERVLAAVAAPGGVYLHCKPPVQGDKSKLVFACLESNSVEDVVDCPRSWTLHAARGGCWAWKKVGGSGGRPRENALSFVVAKDGSLVDSPRKFPAGSAIPIKASP